MSDIEVDGMRVKVKQRTERRCDPFERGIDDFNKRRPEPQRPPDNKGHGYTDEEIRWFGWMIGRSRVLTKMFKARELMGDYRDLPIDERNVVPSDGSDPNDDGPRAA